MDCIYLIKQINSGKTTGTTTALREEHQNPELLQYIYAIYVCVCVRVRVCAGVVRARSTTGVGLSVPCASSIPGFARLFGCS